MIPPILTIAIGESTFFGLLALMLATVAISLVIGVRAERGRRECTKELGEVKADMAEMKAPDIRREQTEKFLDHAIQVIAAEREKVERLTVDLRTEREKTVAAVEGSQERLRVTRDLTLEITQAALAGVRAELADAKAQILEERERALRLLQASIP